MAVASSRIVTPKLMFIMGCVSRNLPVVSAMILLLTMAPSIPRLCISAAANVHAFLADSRPLPHYPGH